MSVWDDLTGKSDRWLRTIILSTIAGRLGVITVGMMLEWLTPGFTTDGFSGIIDADDPALFLIAGLIAPLTESLIIVLLVWILAGLLKLSAWLTALLVGLAFVPMHGWTVVSWAIFPLFVLMVVVQFHWRQKGHTWSGYWIITAIHALGNLSAVAVTLAFPDLA